MDTVTNTPPIADTIDELLVLWPALPTALARDAGTTTSERVATSENVHTIPLNGDVAAVILDLQRAIPEWTAWAAQIVGESRNDHAGTPDHLKRIPALHDRLRGQGRTADAKLLEHTTNGWLTRCRTALGLNRPDRGTGLRCPNHDQPLSLLIQPGDHGHLQYAKLDSAGHPVDAWVNWTRTDLIMCRHCDSIWTPARYMWLGRLIRDADHRRQTTTQGETDDAA